MKYDHCAKCRDEVVWYAFFVNMAQVFFKGTLGLLSGSAALVADAFHSSADLIANVVTMISLRISSKSADEDHTYGHGNIQYISSSIVGLILIGGALFLLATSIKTIVSGNIEAPSRIALFGALISISLNEIMYRYQSCVGKECNSPAIIANAWDNRSDAFSSFAVLVGIIFATFGFPIADPLAAIGVSLVVIKIGVGLNKDAVDGLMDSAPEIDELKKIYGIAKGVHGILGISYLRGRTVGESLHVDIEVYVDSAIKVYESDLIVDVIKEKIIEGNEHVDNIQVFISPVVVKVEKKKRGLFEFRRASA
jgi:cation diffusion facilitator family transporter